MRNYNPSISRFISRDSFAGSLNDPLSLNLYTYCGNNPIIFTDPLGHDAAATFMVSNPKSTVNSANDAKLAYKWNNMYKEKLNAPASVNSPSDAIVASENGTVEDIHDIKKYGNGSFGNYVLVSYGDYLAIYAHLNSEPSHLNIGQKINAGDL